MATIGQTLGGARRDQGLSIEDVAHSTRIHSTMIQCIENDDFSMFPSVAYAKSFVRKYSEFLDVDVSGGLQALNSGVSVRLADNELMNEMKKTIKKDRRFRIERLTKGARRRLSKPSGSPVLLNLVLLVLIGAMGIFYFLGYDASSPEEARADITNGLKKATPFLGHADPEMGKDSLPAHPLNSPVQGGGNDQPILVAKPIPMEDLLVKEPVEGPEAEIIERPHVTLELEEPPVAIVGDGRQAREKLKPRLTPGLPLETNISATPLQSAKLEQLKQDSGEAARQLSPSELDPGIKPIKPDGTAEDRSTRTTRPGTVQVSPNAIRALPVAARE